MFMNLNITQNLNVDSNLSVGGNILIQGNLDLTNNLLKLGYNTDPIAKTGTIRYNPNNKAFEGFSENLWNSLGGESVISGIGIADRDGNTKILTEINEDNNDELLFYTGDKRNQINGIAHIRMNLSGSNIYSNLNIYNGEETLAHYLNLQIGQNNHILNYSENADFKIQQKNTDKIVIQDSNNIIFNGKIGIDTNNPLANLHISGTDGLILPIGDENNKGQTSMGKIRYNTELNTFEGCDGSNWGSLGGVSDVNQDTYISAETTANSNNDELRFYTGENNNNFVDEHLNPKMIIDGNVNILYNTNINSNVNIFANTNILGDINIKGDIIPQQDSIYDLGSASNRFKDLYISNNSLWIGDINKISVSSSNELTFNKRKLNNIPKIISQHNIHNGMDNNQITTHVINYFHNKGLNHINTLSNITIDNWLYYYNYITSGEHKITDIFSEDVDDYESMSTATNWKNNSNNIYYDTGNIGIGTSNPLYKFDLYDDTNNSAKFTLRSSDQTLEFCSYDNSNTDTRYSYLQSRQQGIAFNSDLLLNPAGGNVGIGTPTPQTKLDIEGDVNFQGKIYQGRSELIPVGCIIMWYGNDTAVPSGWFICDGTNGTPDLRDKFIVGAGSTYVPNDVGGEASHTLTSHEMPVHDHSGYAQNKDINHTHTGSTGYNSHNHTHSYNDIYHSEWGGHISLPSNRGSGDTDGDNGGYEISRTTAGVSQNHTHNFTTGLMNSNTIHGHTLDINPAGGGAAHNNIPPYYALYYIMFKGINI